MDKTNSTAAAAAANVSSGQSRGSPLIRHIEYGIVLDPNGMCDRNKERESRSEPASDRHEDGDTLDAALETNFEFGVYV